jgi:ribonucleoside-diphosphate reductase alpha chain
MGLHEWLLKRNEKYEVTPELHSWLEVYRDESTAAAASHAERLFLNTPKAYRAIAPSGTIGLLAGTTQGIEPLYATAFKRRYLRNQEWAYQYIVDPTAKHIIDTTGCRPDSIDTAYSLAADPERRIKFQADIQHYVDMGISSTINLPPWGSDLNNETTARQLAKTIAAYCPNLRGITVYPDGAISGQPLEEVDYYEAIKHEGVIYEENDSACKSGVCGI